MEKLYRKVGKRYEEVGTSYNTDFIYKGLFFTKQSQYGKHTENILYWLKDISKPIDVQLLTEIHTTKDDILKYLTSVTNKTANDIANDILEIIYNKLKRRSEPVDKLDEISKKLYDFIDHQSTIEELELVDKISKEIQKLKLD